VTELAKAMAPCRRDALEQALDGTDKHFDDPFARTARKAGVVLQLLQRILMDDPPRSRKVNYDRMRIANAAGSRDHDPDAPPDPLFLVREEPSHCKLHLERELGLDLLRDREELAGGEGTPYCCGPGRGQGSAGSHWCGSGIAGLGIAAHGMAIAAAQTGTTVPVFRDTLGVDVKDSLLRAVRPEVDGGSPGPSARGGSHVRALDAVDQVTASGTATLDGRAK